MAGLSFWNESGKLIYENPRLMKFVQIIQSTSYTGGTQVTLPVGNNLVAVCFATATKTINNQSQQITGAISGFGTMHNFSGNTLNWNIPSNSRIGGWFPPFTNVRFNFHILAR